MKKALVILMALSMVFAAFADEPAVKSEIAEFTGNATVTWGVNLDGQTTPNSEESDAKTYTGFSNSEEAKLKFTLISAGDKSTTGEGVWGEIKIKLADDPEQYVSKNDAGFAWDARKVAVGSAKIHLNDMLAIGIRKGDNTYGKYEPAVAVHNYVEDRKVDGAAAYTGDGIKQGSEVGGTVTQGITIEFTNDLLDANIDFRSTPLTQAAINSVSGYKADDLIKAYLLGHGYTGMTDDQYKAMKKFDGSNWDAYQAYLAAKARIDAQLAYVPDGAEGVFTDRYGIGTDVNVKAVDNLSLKLGFGIDFWNWKRTDENNPFGLYAAADYKLAIDDTFYLKPQVAFTMQSAYDASATKMKTTNKLMGALLFGWGDDATQDPVKWVDGKVRNGFSVATELDLSERGDDEDMVVPLCVGVWDSTFVDGLKAGAELHVNNLSKFEDDKFYVAFDAAYTLSDLSITPKFALKMQTKDLFIFGAVEYTGIANTTLTFAYESGSLTADDPVKGKLSLSAKVSF